MLSKFICDDLSKRNRKISSQRLLSAPLSIPIEIIRKQKQLSQRISLECHKGLRSQVNFIKKQIENEAVKKKQKNGNKLMVSRIENNNIKTMLEELKENKTPLPELRKHCINKDNSLAKETLRREEGGQDTQRTILMIQSFQIRPQKRFYRSSRN